MLSSQEMMVFDVFSVSKPITVTTLSAGSAGAQMVVPTSKPVISVLSAGRSHRFSKLFLC